MELQPHQRQGFRLIRNTDGFRKLLKSSIPGSGDICYVESYIPPKKYNRVKTAFVRPAIRPIEIIREAIIHYASNSLFSVIIHTSMQ